MQNLYDLLSVRPDDDAETIKKAFREAAKASHPDHHGDDPHAAARFRRISEAYEILRDAEQRAAYDQLLEIERRPLRHEMKRSWSGMKRHVVQDLMAGAFLAIVLAIGYEWFARTPQTPDNGAAVVTLRESGQAAADRPAERSDAGRRDMAERAPAPQMPIAVPATPAVEASAAHGDGQPERSNGKPVSDPVTQTVAVAGRDSESDVPARVGVASRTEDEPHVEPDEPSLDALASAAEHRENVPAAEHWRDGKAPEPAAGANRDSVKPEIKVSAPAAPKRHAPNRRPIEQAALENRNTPVENRSAVATTPDNTRSRSFGVGF